jgi:hypothetical protein
MHRTHVLAVLAAAIVVPIGAAPATAQFGSLFDPPRPPTDVPGRPPARQPPPDPYAAQPPPAYPAQPAPPIQQTVPARGGIQSQPLPPPPGATAAPPAQPAPQPGTFAAPPAGQAVPLPPPGPPGAALQPGDEVITALPTQKIVNPTAVFSGLDKITGRITAFDAAIGETVQFGALQVTASACYSRPPTETPLTDGFVEVDEVTLQGEVRRIFTGWMFAASPGLHAVEHAIYDVWLIDCKGGAQAVADAQPAPPPAPPPRQGTPQQRQAAPQQRQPSGQQLRQTSPPPGFGRQ